MASRPPSFADLLLAFRQAKKAIATERGGVGLFNLARFEMRLATRIRQLRTQLKNDRWFDAIDIGRLIVMPKSTAATSPPQKRDIVRVGQHYPEKVKLGVRLQLEPSPEFTITEVLYLWEFGGAIEALLDPSSCVGYRLRRVRKDGVMSREAGEVYDDWTSAFEQYRDDPIRVGATALREGKRVIITSTDVASFFYSLDPNFLLQDSFIAELRDAAARLDRPFALSRYRTATKSLLKKFQAFRYLRRSAAGATIDVEIGVPIGALTSRVFANVALASLDSYINERPGVILYRRYVDDIVIVSAYEPNLVIPKSKAAVLKELFPGFAEGKQNDQFVVPSIGATFELNEGKTRIHDLLGPAGIDFLTAVKRSFSAVTSERRAFLGDVERLEEELEFVDVFNDGAAGTDQTPLLRDADHFTLRRFMASVLVKGLKRCALLLDEQEAISFLEQRTKRILSILSTTVKLEDFEFVIKLLKVALLCNCATVADELRRWLDQRMGSELLERVDQVLWRGEELPRLRTLRLLQSYFRRRIQESTTSAGPLSHSVPAVARSKALLLRRADLRYLDREDDVAVFGHLNSELPMSVISEHKSVRTALRRDQNANAILTNVRLFIEQSNRLSEKIWSGVSDVGLLLSVKPPSYADVARRFLARAETDHVITEVGKQIDACVDALRGTRYLYRWSPAIAFETTEKTAHLRMVHTAGPLLVRVILSNLPVHLEEFKAAVSGHPQLTLNRLRRMDQSLRDAQKASAGARRRRFPSILLFPELSVPRRWMRDLARHAVEERLSIVAGIEYETTANGLVNQAMGVFPDPWKNAAIVRWTKRHPAREEEAFLQSQPVPLHVRSNDGPSKRLIVESAHGRIGVLICSELLETAALSEVSGNVELLLVPSWNRDTPSFDHVAHAAASLLVHAFVCVANNAEASDSRIVAPIKEPRREREWCRLIHRGENQIVWGDLPVTQLRSVHDGIEPVQFDWSPDEPRKYRPLPPGWKAPG